MALIALSPSRRRLRIVLAAFTISVLCGLSGVVLTFVLAPAQAIQAFRLSRLPVMNARTIDSAAVGDTLLFTGMITDNVPVDDNLDLVAYSVEEWRVTVPDADGGSEPYSRWEAVETVVPALTVNLDGRTVLIHRAVGGQAGRGSPREDDQGHRSYTGQV